MSGSWADGIVLLQVVCQANNRCSRRVCKFESTGQFQEGVRLVSSFVYGDKYGYFWKHLQTISTVLSQPQL